MSPLRPDAGPACGPPPLHASIGNSGLAVLGASVVIEVADKTVSIIVAAATAFLREPARLPRRGRVLQQRDRHSGR